MGLDCGIKLLLSWILIGYHPKWMTNLHAFIYRGVNLSQFNVWIWSFHSLTLSHFSIAWFFMLQNAAQFFDFWNTKRRRRCVDRKHFRSDWREKKKEIDFSKFRSLLRLTFQTTKISVIVFAFDTKHQNTNGRNNTIEIYNQMKM